MQDHLTIQKIAKLYTTQVALLFKSNLEHNIVEVEVYLHILEITLLLLQDMEESQWELTPTMLEQIINTGK